MNERKLALDPYKHHIDFYDQMFDRRGEGVPVWKRNTREFPTRREQFALLQGAELFNVPPHGVKGERMTPARWSCEGKRYAPGPHTGCDDDTETVAYTDETMHQGMGKERMPYKDVPDGMFWSRYMPTFDGKGHSIRCLCIGERWYICLVYRSEDWRSNYQTTEVGITTFCDLKATFDVPSTVRWMHEQMRQLKSPLLAIDATWSKNELWVTDLNLAPGFEACIHDHLTSTKIVDAIKDFYFKHCEPAADQPPAALWFRSEVVDACRTRT